MAYAPWQIKVLSRYGLVDQNGAPVSALLTTLGDEKPGFKLDPEVIKRLFGADSTTNHVWSALASNGHSWIFYQAGGGDAAVRQSEQSLSYLKQRFINQYNEDKWTEHEAKFREELFSADQDVCQKMRGSFGFYRNWPGRESVYEKIVVTLTTFLKQYRKLLEMNKNVPATNQQPFAPDKIDSWQKMAEINSKVANWVAAKRVRTDVRLASHKQEQWIYNDDVVMAIAPLTYAAAVKYGWQKWDVADPDKFATVSQGELSSNPWDRFLKAGGLVVMVEFHVPMPRWVERSGSGKQTDYSSYTLNNLLFSLNPEEVRANPDGWTAHDEQNHEITVAQIKDMIRHEAAPEPDVVAPVIRRGYHQQPHPLYAPKEDQPIKRGASVLANRQEAEELISHFNQCLDEVQKWAKSFRGKIARVMPGSEA